MFVGVFFPPFTRTKIRAQILVALVWVIFHSVLLIPPVLFFTLKNPVFPSLKQAVVLYSEKLFD